ncbi:MAG: hypothetical protein V4668_02700 [Patescibacteria group bacterium]
MKKIIVIIIGILVLLGGYYAYIYWALGNDSVSQTNQDTSVKFEYLEGLEPEVYKTIDAKTDGLWDKTLTLTAIEVSQNAAYGTWIANDAWSWIAWKGTDQQWETLVSLDGFDCEALQTVPAEYADFFYDSTHVNGEQYCYAHE